MGFTTTKTRVGGDRQRGHTAYTTVNRGDNLSWLERTSSREGVTASVWR